MKLKSIEPKASAEQVVNAATLQFRH